jgi:hypothetical protein
MASRERCTGGLSDSHDAEMGSLRHTEQNGFRAPQAITPNGLRNSLLARDNTLFSRTVSLFVGLGNYLRSCCVAAFPGRITRLWVTKIDNFPVKFPVSRDIAWRQARSALRRQPGIPVFREFPSFDKKGPPNAGFSYCRKSLETDVRTFRAENSRKSPAESRKTPVFWRLAPETEG